MTRDGDSRRAVPFVYQAQKIMEKFVPYADCNTPWGMV